MQVETVFDQLKYLRLIFSPNLFTNVFQKFKFWNFKVLHSFEMVLGRRGISHKVVELFHSSEMLTFEF